MNIQNSIQLVDARYFKSRLPVHLRTVKRWVHNNQFPQSRLVGNRCLWNKTDIDDWFDGTWTPEEGEEAA